MTLTIDRQITQFRATRTAPLWWWRTLRAAVPWVAPWRAARRIAEQDRDINLLILTLGDVTGQLAEAQTAQR